MMEIRIRRAAPEEHAALTKISFAAKRVWNYPEEYYRLWRDELTITPQYIEKNQVFVADRAGEPIGYGSIVEVRSDFLAGKVPVPKGHYLEHLFLLPQWQRRGVGSRLMEYARQYARGQGIRSLLIFSDPHASGFYDRQGAIYRGESPSSIEGRTTPVYEYRVE